MPTPYVQFAVRMLHGDSKWLPEILKEMIDPATAELLLALPGSASLMAQQLGRDEAEVEAALNDLFRKGLAFKKAKPEGTFWRAAAHLAQFHDASILWPEATPRFLELWRHYMEEEWPVLARQLATVLPRPYTRVIPIGETVSGKAAVLAPESLEQMIESSYALAVTNCTCRLTMHKCDAPVEVCLQVDKGAEYTLERGTGRAVSKTEALEIARQSREAGLVHVTMNKAGLSHFICNCCGCCCQAFSLLISDGVEICDPSRYRAEVSAESCTACEECEPRCVFGAITHNGEGIAVIDAETCMGCGQCAYICPEEAIAMTAVQEAGFIPGL